MVKKVLDTREAAGGQFGIYTQLLPRRAGFRGLTWPVPSCGGAVARYSLVKASTLGNHGRPIR